MAQPGGRAMRDIVIIGQPFSSPYSNSNANNEFNVNSDGNLNNNNNANNSNGVAPALGFFKKRVSFLKLWLMNLLVIRKRSKEHIQYSLSVIRVSYTVNKITFKILNIVRDSFSRDIL